MKISYRAERGGVADHLRGLSNGGITVMPMKYGDKKIVYMKAPRTGGTSVLNTLKRNGVKPMNPLKGWLQDITDEELKEYLIFSFVRNPWDRLISVSRYFRFKPKYFVTGLRAGKPISKNARRHAYPCSLFTHKDGKQFVDVIFRYENLQNDFNLLCDYLGVTRSSLPHLSKSRKTREYSSSYVIGGKLDLGVRQKYKDDVELLGYDFCDGD